MRFIQLIILILVLSSCVSTSDYPSFYESPARAVTIMTYNVGNLFDTKHDEGKNDHTYLPLEKKTANVMRACDRIPQSWWRKSCREKNWNEEALNLLLSRLSDVILSAKKNGPEIIIFEEVENKSIVERLRNKFLSGKGYLPAIHLETSDRRGIDIAILSKLPLIKGPYQYPITLEGRGKLKRFSKNWKNNKKSYREILHAVVKLPDGSPLNVMGLHFSSQSLPVEARRQSIAVLNKATAQLRKRNEMVVVGGDFNISKKEERKSQLYRKLSSKWLVAHLMGCDKCRGTYYYHRDRSWSFLDSILFSKNMKEQSKWVVLPKSVRVFNKNVYQTNRYGSPAKFKVKAAIGVSDHWPLLVDIALKKDIKKKTKKKIKKRVR